MNQQGITIKIFASLLFVLAFSSIAQAQDRVFVSSSGNDANPCTRTAPCRTFQHGHDVVTAGGEVVALDSAGFGGLSITKSVTINGENVHAVITGTSGNNGVTINSATAVVVLRNLSIYGLGSGLEGILVVNATSLHVENCVIQGFADFGLLVENSANVFIQTFVKDTVMRKNSGNGVGGGKAIFENCRFENNGIGFEVFAGAKATLHNCVVAGSGGTGLIAELAAQMMVDNCQISNNGTGIKVDLNGQIRVSNSQINNNITGLAAAGGGTILSRISAGVATNTVEDNGANGVFTGTYLAK